MGKTMYVTMYRESTGSSITRIVEARDDCEAVYFFFEYLGCLPEDFVDQGWRVKVEARNATK